MTNVKIPSAEYFEAWRQWAEEIKIGMTRGIVEACLGQHWGGIQGASITIYHPRPGVKLEVPFDQYGSPGHPKNRVNGPVKVFHVAEV